MPPLRCTARQRRSPRRPRRARTRRSPRPNIAVPWRSPHPNGTQRSAPRLCRSYPSHNPGRRRTLRRHGTSAPRSARRRRNRRRTGTRRIQQMDHTAHHRNLRHSCTPALVALAAAPSSVSRLRRLRRRQQPAMRTPAPTGIGCQTLALLHAASRQSLAVQGYLEDQRVQPPTVVRSSALSASWFTGSRSENCQRGLGGSCFPFVSREPLRSASLLPVRLLRAQPESTHLTSKPGSARAATLCDRIGNWGVSPSCTLRACFLRQRSRTPTARGRIRQIFREEDEWHGAHTR
jgi:hypothetical protein